MTTSTYCNHLRGPRSIQFTPQPRGFVVRPSRHGVSPAQQRGDAGRISELTARGPFDGSDLCPGVEREIDQSFGQPGLGSRLLAAGGNLLAAVELTISAEASHVSHVRVVHKVRNAADVQGRG